MIKINLRTPKTVAMLANQKEIAKACAPHKNLPLNDIGTAFNAGIPLNKIAERFNLPPELIPLLDNQFAFDHLKFKNNLTMLSWLRAASNQFDNEISGYCFLEKDEIILKAQQGAFRSSPSHDKKTVFHTHPSNEVRYSYDDLFDFLAHKNQHESIIAARKEILIMKKKQSPLIHSATHQFIRDLCFNFIKATILDNPLNLDQEYLSTYALEFAFQTTFEALLKINDEYVNCKTNEIKLLSALGIESIKLAPRIETKIAPSRIDLELFYSTLKGFYEQPFEWVMEKKKSYIPSMAIMGEITLQKTLKSMTSSLMSPPPKTSSPS